jgi:GlpG protein
MRLIGRLNNESNAKTFGDYLTSLDVVNSTEGEADGQWAIWVHSEDQLQVANAALASFRQNPNDLKYQQASVKAAAKRERVEKEKSEYARRVVTSDALWPSYSMGPLTVVLMGICVAMAALYGLPPLRAPWLWMSENLSRALPEVRQGQVWRLLTPIFIHMNIEHILFNMLALKTLGSMIEARRGWFTLLCQVVVMGVLSNVGQDFVGGPFFGGFSGVLYGMFGYIWMQGIFDPTSGLRLMPTNIVMMLGWFVLCLVGVIPGVANGAHGFGLVVGMVWGVTPPLVKKIFRA